jgi:hypothetical protein
LKEGLFAISQDAFYCQPASALGRGFAASAFLPELQADGCSEAFPGIRTLVPASPIFRSKYFSGKCRPTENWIHFRIHSGGQGQA